MARLVYSPEARDDLRQIAAYIEEMTSLDTAEAFDLRLRATCRAMAETPFTGSPRPQFGKGVCMHAYGSYLIFHRRDDDTLTIIRVLHASRNITKRFFKR